MWTSFTPSLPLSLPIHPHSSPRCPLRSPPQLALNTPGEQLVRAAMLRDLPTVQTLLSTGTPPGYASTQGESGMTALMWAASEGDVPITKALLQAGASPNASTSQGMTPLLYAFDNIPNANPLPPPPPGFPGTKRSAPPQVPQTPRISGHGDVAKLLLVAGADMKKVTRYGESCLHLVARKARVEWVDVLVGGEVDVNLKSGGYEETALHVAAKEGHREMCEKLIDVGGKVNERSRFGWTPVLWAAACGHVGVLETLLERGGEADIVASGGVTAISEGRKSGKPREVERLLRKWGARG